MLVITHLGGCTIFNADHDPDDDRPLNTSYVIEGETIALVNGFSARPAAPGSSTQVTTEVWGSPAFADLNTDGHQDAALILIHSPGGSGTFYYAVAAIWRDDGYRGSSALFIGDRIEPRSIEIERNQITVRFLDRTQGEAFSTPPANAMQQLLIYDPDSNRLKVAD